MALTINKIFIETLCCPWAMQKNFLTMVLLIMKINKFLVWCKLNDLKVMCKIHAVAIIYIKQTSWTSGHARKLHITVMVYSQMEGQSRIFLYVLDIYMYKHKVLYIYIYIFSLMHKSDHILAHLSFLYLCLDGYIFFLNVW